MYLTYFNLDESPFSITPDPRFVYLTQRHREALAHLLYGLGEGGGFVQLTGEVGTGKTTICRTLLKQLPEHVDVALLFNPQLSVPELLQSICGELRIDLCDEALTIKALIDRLYAYLLDANARGRRTVLIVDEAQNLSTEVLEEIRLLTNLETDDAKLLQVFLIGQPELRAKLERQDLRQLTQRITARYHLEPLGLGETQLYILHRLSVAGCEHKLFTSGAMRKVYRLTGGIPRRINILCDRALLGAYSTDELRVDASIVTRASMEIEDRKRTTTRRVARSAGIALAMVGVMSLGGLALRPNDLPVLDWIARAPAALSSGLQAPSRPAKRPPPAGTSGTGPEEFVSAIVPLPDTNPAPAPEPSSEQLPPDPPSSMSTPLPHPTARSVAPPLPRSPANSVAPPLPQPAVNSVSPPPASTPPLASRMPATETAQPLSLEEAIATVVDDGWTEAVRGLARLWGVEPPSTDEELCDWAGTEGLSCYSKSATRAQLRGLDLPAVLALSTTQDVTVHALLVKLSEDGASLLLADREQRIGQQELEQLWGGDYVLLWRPPFAGKHPIKRGEKGRRARWLRDVLDSIDGADPSASQSETFDSGLVARVKDFQRQNGLEADGIVGPRTLIHLTRMASSDAAPGIVASGANPHASSPRSVAMGPS